MQCRYLDLNSFDSVTTDEPYLSVSTLLPGWLSQFECYQPLDLRFELWVAWIDCNIFNVQASQGETRGVTVAVDSTDIFEWDVISGTFMSQWLIVAWSHLCVRIITWIRELEAY